MIMSVYDRHYIQRMDKNAGKLCSFALTSWHTIPITA